MEIKNLITFLKIAEYESFTKAATVLGYTQPTITFQLKQLESELQIKLFDRIGNHIQITEAGTSLLDYAKQIVCLAEEANHVITKNDTPPLLPLRITGVCSACLGLLPELIRQYHQKYPNIRFEANTSNIDDIYLKLVNGSTDIGIIMDFSKSCNDFQIAYVESNPLCFICAPDNPLASMKSVDLQSLATFPLIVTEKHCSYRTLFMEMVTQYNSNPNLVFESENTEIIKRFVAYGLGISLLPEIAVRQELEEKKLCKIPVSISLPDTYIKIVYHKNKWISPVMNNFLDLLQKLPQNS